MKEHYLTLAFLSASHLKNDSHDRNSAAVSPLEKMIGWTLFLRYLGGNVRKDFSIKYLRPVPETILFSEEERWETAEKLEDNGLSV